MNYQYHIYNEYFNLLVSTNIDNEEYAINLGKRVAVDYYKVKESQLDNVKCNLIVEFRYDSVINLNALHKD